MERSLLRQILREYEQKRNKAILDADLRKKELLLANPELIEIESKLSSSSIQAARAIITADKQEKDKILSDLKTKINLLQKEKEDFIKSISKKTDLFSPQFECKLCKDTGYIQKNSTSIICNCLKQKIFDIAYNKSNIGNLEKENFLNFNIKLFSDKENTEKFGSEISPKQNMILLKEKAGNFIENFDSPDEKNLLFTGGTGVGKTFLTNCIANEILKQGKIVLYQTAPVMFDNIIDAKFGKVNSSIDLLENILNVDLLIIDDLGTEKTDELRITELFTIINTRLLNQNHKVTKTIISTNLNLNELVNNYTNRIGSRLIGNYRFLRFFGEDLRYSKKKQETS